MGEARELVQKKKTHGVTEYWGFLRDTRKDYPDHPESLYPDVVEYPNGCAHPQAPHSCDLPEVATSTDLVAEWPGQAVPCFDSLLEVQFAVNRLLAAVRR